MISIVDTVKSIDDNSKKIMFKHFDSDVNILAREAPKLIQKILEVGNLAV